MDERYTFANPLGQLRIERTLDALEMRSMTVVQLAADLHMSETTARTVVRYLRRLKKIYITRWTLVGMNYTPMYRPGNEQDAQKPARLSRQQKHWLYETRLRQDIKQLAKQHIAGSI